MASDESHRIGCLMICGAALRYSQESFDHICAICGAPKSANVACEAGHSVCDSCHCGSANELIQRA